MAIRLSAADLSRLEAASRLLLSPLDYQDTSTWCAAVIRELKSAFSADVGTFFLPGEGGGQRLVARDFFTEKDLEEFREFTPELENKYGRTGKALAAGVSTMRSLYRERLPEYLADTFYNEFLLPRSCYPRLLFAVADGAGVASLYLHQGTPPDPKQEERGLLLSRLLFPSLASGLRTSIRLGQHSGTLTEVLDLISDAVLVCDSTGRVLHANRALSDLLSGDPQRDLLRAALQRMARELCAEKSAPASLRQVVIELRTTLAKYRLRSGYLGEGLLGGRRSLLIALERITPAPPSQADLRQRLGLTKAEAKVALLLAERKTNAEISQALSISPHTARHHTESVLRKLGLHSRSAVAGRLLRD